MRKKKKQKINLSLSEIIHLLEKYNSKHKTHYTYGQFIDLIHSKKIQFDEIKE